MKNFKATVIVSFLVIFLSSNVNAFVAQNKLESNIQETNSNNDTLVFAHVVSHHFIIFEIHFVDFSILDFSTWRSHI